VGALDRAVELYRRAREVGRLDEACYNLAATYNTRARPGDAARGRQAITRACMLGDADALQVLGLPLAPSPLTIAVFVETAYAGSLPSKNAC
jgi:TPR repeat protein